MHAIVPFFVLLTYFYVWFGYEVYAFANVLNRGLLSRSIAHGSLFLPLFYTCQQLLYVYCIA